MDRIDQGSKDIITGIERVEISHPEPIVHPRRVTPTTTTRTTHAQPPQTNLENSNTHLPPQPQRDYD
jgi:hypothetical protein